MSEFLQAVANRVDLEVEHVDEVLTRYGVRESGVLPRPHKLLVRRVQFSGEKTGKSTGSVDFSWDVDEGLWCVTADNLKGKSSILEIIWWCLRGSDHLQTDVRRWLHRVSLNAEIDGEPFQVSADITDRQLTGELTVGHNSLPITFTGDKEFASVMGQFMMSRLGLEPLRTWRKGESNTNSDSPDISAEKSDGQVVITSWPAFSHALLCRNRENDALLGQTAGGGTMVSLLQMYVGLPWTTTRRDTQTALSLAEQSRRGERRRAQQDLQARSTSLEELQDQLVRARERVAQAEAAPTLQEVTHSVEKAAADLNESTARHSALMERMRQARRSEEELREALVADQSRLRDLRETAAAERFFGALTPTCCPRCSTALTELPHADLGDQHCGICGSVPAEASHEPAAIAQLTESIEILEQSQRKARQATRELETSVATAEHAVEVARTAFTSAEASLPEQSTLHAYLELARLEGRIEERQDAERRAVRPESASREEQILQAAAKEADKRAKSATSQLLEDVSQEICRLAVRLGASEIQNIKLSGNGSMKVWKGGSDTTFTKVTPGEQVRLRIATLLALLRIGQQSGVGRHPGLLLLDSPGAQESIDVDLAEVLSQLHGICEETPGLQVITATAKRDVAVNVIPEHRIKAAAPGRPVW
ncbi:coiled-coil domain-containing protein [Nocardiopsis alba]|uniref:hypothetical protein n=1 Tax=Nocardiopsis alba TaxID=53437 RepID=UPI000AE90DE0|nr:hypothetical protein [Nocardiopsis alba]